MVHERNIKETKLAQQIYATCAAEALFQEQSQENGIA